MSGQTAYEINGVTVAMTDGEKARWDAGELIPADFTSIRVYVGEDRFWPGGMPSLKTVRNSSLFADVARKLDGVADEPIVRPWHEWRDVKKELPGDDALVLICSPSWLYAGRTSIHIAVYFRDSSGWYLFGRNIPDGITHWMPMPPNPEIV